MKLAIHKILNEDSYFSKEVSKTMMSHIIEGKPIQPRPLEPHDVVLTNREKEIIRMIAGELTNMEIADSLGISSRTVDTHRRNLLQKLKAKNTAGLVKYAMQYGLT